jgi:hypothetical protein
MHNLSDDHVKSASSIYRPSSLLLQYLENVIWVSPPPTPCLNAGMSDCPASSQPGTGMNRNSDAGTSSVSE